MPQTTVVEIVLGVLGLLALGLAVLTLMKQRAIAKDLLLARGSDDEVSIIGSVADQSRRVRGLTEDVEQVHRELAVMRRDLAAALRHVAIVRFDAFGDMGGRLSFSAALLDDNGDGVLLTSIHGHTESRMYVKSVHERTIDGRISPEEAEAIRTASPIGN